MSRDVRFQIAINREPDPALTNDATEIEVVQSIDEPWTFRIRFAADVCDGDVPLLRDERLAPGEPDTEVSVLAVVGEETFCLIHGVITNRKDNLTEGGPGSSVEITGSDRRVVMDREQRVAHHEGKASEIVSKILSDYEFELDVEETTIDYSEDDHELAQRATDLEFVTRLAGQNDFYFWVDCDASSGPAGLDLTEIAHFKPSPPRPEDSGLLSVARTSLAPDDPPVIKINTGDGCSNILMFERESNAEAPNQTGSIERVNADDAAVDDTDIPSPTTELLGDVTQPPQLRSRRLVTAGSVEEARIQNRAALNDASWSVSARAETSVFALGGIVKPHQVIEVTGSGGVIDGAYFVKAVTHSLDPADHKMRLELLRNASGG